MNNLITLHETIIHQDEYGLYRLNDLHKASGGAKRHQPSDWLRLQQTKEFIAKLEGNLGIKGEAQIRASSQDQVLRIVKGGSGRQGVFVCKRLVLLR